MKICSSCEKIKKDTSFAPIGGDRLNSRCRICVMEGRLIPCEPKKKQYKKKREYTFQGLSDVNATKNDFIETYLFIKSIGYDLNNSIHEQFCIKHNLEYKGEQVFNNYFSPKDCGLT